MTADIVDFEIYRASFVAQTRRRLRREVPPERAGAAVLSIATRRTSKPKPKRRRRRSMVFHLALAARGWGGLWRHADLIDWLWAPAQRVRLTHFESRLLEVWGEQPSGFVGRDVKVLHRIVCRVLSTYEELPAPPRRTVHL